MENGWLIFFSKKTYHYLLITWTLQNSGIAHTQLRECGIAKFCALCCFYWAKSSRNGSKFLCYVPQKSRKSFANENPTYKSSNIETEVCFGNLVYMLGSNHSVDINWKTHLFHRKTLNSAAKKSLTDCKFIKIISM